MNLPLFIGTRYVKAKNSGGASVTSIISIVSIMLGTAALIVVLSVMNGVTSQVRDKIMSMTAHASLIPTFSALTLDDDVDQYLKKEPRVLAKAPYIYGQALIGEGQSYNGIVVKGVDPTQEAGVSKTIAKMPNELAKLQPGKFNIIIGRKLADSLGAYIGDKITLIVPKTTVTAVGIQPRIKRFTIVGLFDAGHHVFDTTYTLINLKDAGVLFRLEKAITGYQLKLSKPLDAPEISAEINKILPSELKITDWTEQNASYFDAVKVEKLMLFMVLFIILVVAYINILSTLFMTVSEKRGDIAILRTIGMRKNKIVIIFMIQGIILGFIGTILGFLLGYL